MQLMYGYQVLQSSRGARRNSILQICRSILRPAAVVVDFRKNSLVNGDLELTYETHPSPNLGVRSSERLKRERRKKVWKIVSKVNCLSQFTALYSDPNWMEDIMGQQKHTSTKAGKGKKERRVKNGQMMLTTKVYRF